jgi:uncharacterized protein YgbK (DUF1537 family)
MIDVPDAAAPIPDVDAIVVALKSRSIPAAEAIAQSIDALAWLRRSGVRQILFKYCSTFDSTDRGNIGPVAEALMAALDAPFTIYCSAFPEAGRTIFQGHLFVGDRLLSESGMQNHPLNPMTDPDLVRVLGRQTTGRVGLVPHAAVRRGPAAIRARIAELRKAGFKHAIVDAIADEDLIAIGEAAADLALITGGSGIALGLPENFRRQGLLDPAGTAAPIDAPDGRAAVVSGSCSTATLAQVGHFKASRPTFEIDPLRLAEGEDLVTAALAWAGERLGREPILISASAPPDKVAAVQAQLGRERAGTLVEHAMAAVAKGLVERGVRRLVVAGGETSGAVVQALGIKALRIGRQIDPGVPWTVSLKAGASGEPALALALKSGNFGSADFFLKAFTCQP